VQANSSRDPSKKPITKKGWWSGSRCRFKSQYLKKKKKKKKGVWQILCTLKAEYLQ
jgi:hypothetical protein